MNIIIILLIFCLVLFLYMHIIFHNKTCDDLELYEIDKCSKERLEELCDIRQPIILNYDISLFDEFTIDNILSKYSSFDIKIRNVHNFYNEKDEQIYLPIKLENGIKLLQNDDERKYISEKNIEFLEETSLVKSLNSNDEFIRPPMLIESYYDILFGSLDAHTVLQYNKNYRNYLLVLTGKVKIKMAPPKSKKYLYPKNDYENFEFRSLINIWDPEEKYKDNLNKINFLEIDLEPGKIIHIPCNWWYSFKFIEKDTIVASFKYRTYMNMVAILPSIILSFLQKQNIRHQII